MLLSSPDGSGIGIFDGKQNAHHHLLVYLYVTSITCPIFFPTKQCTGGNLLNGGLVVTRQSCLEPRFRSLAIEPSVRGARGGHERGARADDGAHGEGAQLAGPLQTRVSPRHVQSQARVRAVARVVHAGCATPNRRLEPPRRRHSLVGAGFMSRRARDSRSYYLAA